MSVTNVGINDRVDNSSVRLSGTRADPPVDCRSPPLTDIRNVSGRFRVCSGNIVVGWRITYDAIFQGELVRVCQFGEFHNIGTTTVRRPAWVNNVTNLNGKFTAIR